MAAKLRVSLADGIFEAEGEDAFVKEMHSEFREYVGEFFGAVSKQPALPQHNGAVQSHTLNEADDEEEAQEQGEEPGKARRAPARRRRISNPTEGSSAKKVRYEPKTDVDLRLPGLTEAFSTYDFKGHHEMVLFFGYFLTHTAGISPFTANQVFTCYRLVKVKPPKSFAQALYDNRSKRDFFKIENLNAITITHIGDTYVEHDLKKKD